MKKRTASDYKTTKWSGGETTELYIFPEDSSFANGDYGFRLSIATVNIPSSNFTPLPGVDRTLMVLKGSQHLQHEGHHEAKLLPLDQDSFSGDWKTRCVGTSSNFNLMVKNGKGTLTVTHDDIVIDPLAKQVCIYVVEGYLTTGLESVHESELIVLENTKELTLQINGTALIIEII